MSLNVGVPRLPEPSKEWTLGWMQDFIRVLGFWMQQITTPSSVEVGATAFSTSTVSTLVGPNDGCILVDTTGGNITITLPDATTVLGREFTVKRKTAGTNTLTVAATSGTLDAAVTLAIVDQYSTVTFKSDGTNYYIVSGYIASWVP